MILLRETSEPEYGLDSMAATHSGLNMGSVTLDGRGKLLVSLIADTIMSHR